MSTYAASPGALAGPTPRPSADRRIAGPFLLAVAVVVAVLGLRLEFVHHSTTVAARAGVRAVPTNPAIEKAWGIRFTNIVLLSDGGMVELRYQVVNPATAGRIHSGGQNSANLPQVLNEATNSRIKPSAAMLHFHHGDQTADGRTYSIIYGNAGNTVRPGDLVTVEMSDHLKLQHISVTN